MLYTVQILINSAVTHHGYFSLPIILSQFYQFLEICWKFLKSYIDQNSTSMLSTQGNNGVMCPVSAICAMQMLKTKYKCRLYENTNLVNSTLRVIVQVQNALSSNSPVNYIVYFRRLEEQST